MVKTIKNNSGVAVILTVLIISLIVTLSFQFNLAMRSNLHAAANLSDGIRISSIARSGFYCALALLYEDALGSGFDSLHEDWAYSEELSKNTKAMFDRGHVEFRIIDHSGKLPINQLVDRGGEYSPAHRDLLAAYLKSEEFALEPQVVEDILDAVKDWLDPDDEATRFGAENPYYQTLERPCVCRNGRLQSLEEMLLIKGVNRDLFYGKEGRSGIGRYLTIHGQGRININTADPVVLRALSLVILGQDRSEDWMEYRSKAESDLSKPQNYPGMAGLSTAQRQAADQLLTTASSYFEIDSEGVEETMRKGITSVVERDAQGKSFRILSWKTGVDNAG